MKNHFQAALLGLSLAIFANTAQAAVYAIAGDEIKLNGFNLLCDSFDSTDPNRSTDGHYDAAKSGDGARVGLFNGIINSSSVANADIWGYLETGVPFTLGIGPTGTIGSAAWHHAGMTGVEPGHHTTNFSFVFPDPVAPFGGIVPAGGTVDGVNYTYVLDAGNYELNELMLSGNEKVLVRADATLYVRGNVKLSGNALIRIEPSARLRLFVGGESANLGSDGVLNSAGSAGFLYYGLAANTSVTFKNRTLNVLVYAPHAVCTIASPGNATVECEGIVYAKSVSLAADANLHMDEALNP